MMLVLPNRNASDWTLGYELTSNVKFAKQEIPPVVPPTTPEEVEEPKLPQTGLLWWPVPVLLAAGLVLVLVGVVVSRRKKA